MSDWRIFAEQELRAALHDRAQGKAGRARVRARRAAGAIAGAYLRQRGLPDPGPNALERLRALRTLPDLPAAAQQAVAHLLMKVDTQYRLPPGVDLIAAAQILAQSLLHTHLDLKGSSEPQK